MNTLSFILLSKVGLPVGGFAPLIVAILVIYWVYRKDNPSSSYHRTDVDAEQERQNALKTEEDKTLGDLPKHEPDEHHPFAIKSINGEVIATLGIDEACTEDLSSAYLDNLDLCYADFEGADLSNAYIGFCNLTGANFRNADLSNATIECCTVTDADFSGADLSDARIDETTDIWLDAKTDDDTIFPTHHRPSYM